MTLLPLAASFLFATSLQAVAAPTDEATLLAEFTHELPRLGLVVTDLRTLDPVAGVVRQDARDQFGNAVDLGALQIAERRLRRAQQGNLQDELARRVRSAAPGAALPVVFWLQGAEHPDYPVLLRELVEAGNSPQDARQLLLATARAINGPVNEGFAGALAAEGHRIDLVGEFAPNVYATLPAAEVERWARHPSVDTAYLYFTDGGPELNHAQGTLRTHLVHDLGITGATGPTKVLVNDCGEVANHSALPPIVNGTSGGFASHPAGVAGNIAADFSATNFGAAKGLPQLYSHDGCGNEPAAQTAWNWGMTQGIDFGNCSWWSGSKGSIQSIDRMFDYFIRNFSVMMFKSTGNQGNTSTPYTTSPGNGYNMTNTGSYNDGNNSDWSDDAMASYSSYWDPAEGHEKPELASPGDGVTTTGNGSGTQSFGGTSSASPLTTGVAVLLANTDPSLLASMPTLKAALMAGAWHNVEGNALLSEYDGAGGVHAIASQRLVADGQFENGVFTSASFPGGSYDKPVFLFQGDETRVVALWQSNPNTGWTTDVLQMDLDLTVLDPGGAVVASSANAFNAFEIASFIPATSGTYTFRLTNQKFLGASEPYAICWSTKSDAALADVTVSGSPTLGSTLDLAFQSRYEGNVPYLCLVSNKPFVGNLPLFGTGSVLPLAGDRWVRAALNSKLGAFSTGLAGTLNGAGQAAGTFTIPASSVFLGTRFTFAFWTHQIGNTMSVRETSTESTFIVL